MRRSSHIALVGAALAGLTASVPEVRAERASDEVLAPPPTFKGGEANVTERLGARVPVDARFRTHDGALVTLGEVLRGELPTILTFNYADCPMLCSLQLNGLSAVLPAVAELGSVAGADRDVAFRVGGQYRIVTISLEPEEKLARLAAMRARYLAKLPAAQRGLADVGWTFLAAATPGDAAAIKAVAEAVGFGYAYLADRAEWAHPAALIFLSTTGVVTRYVYGIELDPAVVRESIFKAGLAEPSTAVGFMNRCYHFDPDANNHSRGGVLALRIGAAGFLVVFAAGLGVLYKRRRHSEASAGEAP